MKISENVYFYQTKIKGRVYGSNTVVIKGNEQIIIDPGIGKDSHISKLEASMKKDGLSLNDTDEIWLTHSHPDHAAAAGDLVKKLNCRVRCHPSSVAIFESPSPMEYYCAQIAREMNKVNISILSQIFRIFPWFPKKIKIRKIVIPLAVNKIRFLTPFLHLFLWLPSIATVLIEKLLKSLWGYGDMLSVKIHMAFSDGQEVKNGPITIKTIFCPGHAPDEVHFYIPKEEILITGDLIKVQKNAKSKEYLPFIPVLNSQNSDFGDVLSSLEKIKKLSIKVLIPGHRRYVSGKKMIKNLLCQMLKDMKEMKSSVVGLKRKGQSDAKAAKYIIETLSEKYPHCSQQEKIAYSYLLLNHLGYTK